MGSGIMKILIHGTRGKSSLVRFLHSFFYHQGFSVISRETGQNTKLYKNNDEIELERNNRYKGYRAYETIKVVKSFFDNKKYDYLILENNAISFVTSIHISQFFNPDVIIITTWGVDHLEQGKTCEETFRFFLKEVLTSKSCKNAIFWTNFEEEFVSAKTVLKENKLDKNSKIKLIFSEFDRREETILKELSDITCLKNIPKIDKKKEEINKLEIIGNIINIGNINDPRTCQYWISNILEKYENVNFIFNLRSDRKKRTFLFFETIFPILPKKSEKICFVEDIVTFQFCRGKKVNKIYFDPKKLLNEVLKNKDKKYVLLCNEVNKLGEEIKKLQGEM